MMNSTEFQHLLDTLARHTQVTEYDFRSNFPVLGPLVQRVRLMWNNISTRWYVRDYAQQQLQFQIKLLQVIERLYAENQELHGQLDDMTRSIDDMNKSLGVLNIRDAMLKLDIDSIVRQLSLQEQR